MASSQMVRKASWEMMEKMHAMGPRETNIHSTRVQWLPVYSELYDSLGREGEARLRSSALGRAFLCAQLSTGVD